MADIYSKACCVLAWLGTESNDSAQVFQLMPLFEAALSNGTAKDFSVPPELNVAVTKFLNRSWFQRVWILQEYGLAQKLRFCCGDDQCDGRIAVRVLCFLGAYRHISFVDTPFDLEAWLFYLNIPFARKTVSEGGLLRLLVGTRRWQATDSRDKIFALLGLASSLRKSPNLTPDYKSSIAEVYGRAALEIVRSEQSLSILSVARGSTDLSRVLPSWVPDWSDTSEFEQPLPQRSNISDVGRKLSPDTLINQSRSVLCTKGMKHGHTMMLGEVFMPPSRESRLYFRYGAGFSGTSQQLRWSWNVGRHQIPAIQTLSQCYDMGLKHYMTPHNMAIGTYQGTLKDTITYDRPTYERESFQQEIDTYFARLYLWMDEILWSRKLPLGRLCVIAMATLLTFFVSTKLFLISAFLNTALWFFCISVLFKSNSLDHQRAPIIFRYARNRRLAVLDLGGTRYLALVPASTQIGDIVVTLADGEMPLVIRESIVDRCRPASEDPRTVCELVGECYISNFLVKEARDKRMNEVIYFV